MTTIKQLCVWGGIQRHICVQTDFMSKLQKVFVFTAEKSPTRLWCLSKYTSSEHKVNPNYSVVQNPQIYTTNLVSYKPTPTPYKKEKIKALNIKQRIIVYAFHGSYDCWTTGPLHNTCHVKQSESCARHRSFEFLQSSRKNKKKTAGEEHTLVTDASDRCGPGAEALRNVTKFKTCVMTSPWTQHGGQVTVAGAHGHSTVNKEK